MSGPTGAARMPEKEPAADEVWNAYERVVSSGALKASGQLDSFLKFVIRRTLDGKSDCLKAYTIAVEALGRAPSFDPVSDSFVRVTAGRLRQALALYYATECADDPLILDLPRGTYVPTFSWRPETIESDGSGLPPADAAVSPRRRRSVLSAAAIAVVFAVSLAAWLVGSERVGGTRPVRPAATAGKMARVGVTVAVHPLEVIGAPAPESPNVSRLGDTLIEAMARFDGLNVLSEPAGADATTSNADYRLTGRVAYAADGATTLSFRLTDVEANTVVWSRTIEDPQAGAVAPAREVSIVSDDRNHRCRAVRRHLDARTRGESPRRTLSPVPGGDDRVLAPLQPGAARGGSGLHEQNR